MLSHVDELELAGAAETLEGLLGVLDAGQLHEDRVVALPLHACASTRRAGRRGCCTMSSARSIACSVTGDLAVGFAVRMTDSPPWMSRPWRIFWPSGQNCHTRTATQHRAIESERRATFCCFWVHLLPSVPRADARTGPTAAGSR